MARHTAPMGDGSAWAIEGALNPSVLRVHVRAALTDRTIDCWRSRRSARSTSIAIASA